MKPLLLSLCLFLIYVAAGQAAPTVNTYDVEVVVFESRYSDLEGGELWIRPEAVVEGANKELPVVLGEKPPVDSALAAAVTALERSGRHRVLAHLQWQQTAEAKSVSKAVKLGSGDTALDGSLRLFLSRFLVVELDLTLREAPAAVGLFGAASAPQNIVYRLNEPRRIKLAEVHYFDHPKFGALVRVAPAKTN